MDALPSTEAAPEVDGNTRSQIWWAALNLIALLTWIYSIIKLFVFDVDVYLVSLVSTDFVWVLNYKLLFLLTATVVAMLATRSLDLGFAVAYIAFYPIVLLVWKLPRFVWKQKSWLLAFAILNAIIGFIRAFKRNFICATIFLLSAVLILGSDNKYVIYSSSGAIFGLTVFAYIRAFLTAFKPSAVFQTYTKVFPLVRKGNFLTVDASVRNVPIETLTEKQLELRNNGLQSVVLYNRACLLVSKKLRDYLGSGANVASYIISLVALLIFIVLSFALINYGLYKTDQTLYKFTYSKESLFAFVYYSAGSMFYSSNGLVPVQPTSQAVQLTQFLFAVLLVVILVAVVLSVRNEKYSTELKDVIAAMEREGRSAEALLVSEFNLNGVASAIEALQKAKAGLVGLIVYLTTNIGEE